MNPFRVSKSGGTRPRFIRLKEQSLSLYLHIPFCIRKCRYCDFLSGPQDEETRERYVQALIREIRYPHSLLQGKPWTVDTVFLGGGTPSVLTAGQIDRIMEAVRSSFSLEETAEISMEMNPGTADLEKLREFRKSGINRLSIGVQSTCDEELRLLGRIHTADQAQEAFSLARKAGFDNLNVDLMSGLPGQSLSAWSSSLARVCAWEPEHISAYSLILEPGTEFADLQEAGKLPPLPEEDTDREMYKYTGEYLADHGYERYEISNYAKPGRECRHNCGYWTGHPYLGLGIGAASYVNNIRFSDGRDLRSYLGNMYAEKTDAGKSDSAKTDAEKTDSAKTDSAKTDAEKTDAEKTDAAETNAIGAEIHVLTEAEQMEEFMFLGLRMTAGVRTADFRDRFSGQEMEEIYGEVIRKHIAQGVLERTEEGVRLTDRGIDVSNYVLADYLL